MRVKITVLKDADGDSSDPKLKKQSRKLAMKGLLKKAQDPDNDGDKDFAVKKGR